jgi:transcriptional regulator with XRE-family HTH domain
MESGILIRISKKIKNIRKEKGLTIQEVADRAGVTKGLISQIENSRTIPSLLVLMQIINAIEVEIDFFFSDLKIKENEAPVLVFKKSEFNHNTEPDKFQELLSRKFRSGQVAIGIRELQPNSSSAYLTEDAFEFVYMLKGSLKFQFMNQIVELDEGDAYFSDARIAHQIINEKKTLNRLLSIQFMENQK